MLTEYGTSKGCRGAAGGGTHSASQRGASGGAGRRLPRTLTAGADNDSAATELLGVRFTPVHSVFELRWKGLALLQQHTTASSDLACNCR